MLGENSSQLVSSIHYRTVRLPDVIDSCPLDRRDCKRLHQIVLRTPKYYESMHRENDTAIDRRRHTRTHFSYRYLALELSFPELRWCPDTRQSSNNRNDSQVRAEPSREKRVSAFRLVLLKNRARCWHRVALDIFFRQHQEF